MLALKIRARAWLREEVDDDLVAGHEAADRGERLREGPGDQVDLVGEPEVLGRAGARVAEDAERVRVVDQDAGAVLLARARRCAGRSTMSPSML